MRQRRQRRGAWVRAVMACAVLLCLGSVVPAVASSPQPRSNYIVSLQADPVATGVAREGRKLDPASPQALEYRRLLDGLEARALQGAFVPRHTVGYRYRMTLAGFSARLTADEAERLRRRPEVAAVTADRIRVVRNRRPATSTAADGERVMPAAAEDTDLAGQTADFLDLPEGLWARLGGPEQAGEGVIIGMIDGGIYPEHPSFADQPIATDGSRNYIGPAYGPPPATWRGTCQEGEAFPATSCNNKLIGARFFVDGWGEGNVAEEDFLSPRDVDGHGTGTASVAAGNYGVDPSYQGNDLGIGVISGIAPRARIAHYKALWAIPAFDGAGFGTESDLAAAVDAAVADGVDIISMSIGDVLGETLPFTDQSTMLNPWSQSLLRAFDAGVLAVLPAGNDGPSAESVESPGHTPWVISAGSSALSTTFIATATVSGPGGPILDARGVSPTPALPAVPLIDGTAAVAPGADPAAAARCARGTLDPALVQGKAVLCRPGSVLVASAVLFELGAAGGVFYIQSPSNRYTTDDVWLPSVVVSRADADAIRAVIASTPGATVSFTAGKATPTTTGDIVKSYSARGPALGSPSILKPDLLAPGDDVIMAHSPDVPPGAGALFDFSKPGLFRPLAGTSFAVPHIAGSAALLLDLHPEYGPSELKSALMTTANPHILRDTAGVPSAPETPRGFGAGRIDPNRAADPGLVLSETPERFRDYVSAQEPTRDPTLPTPDASDLNLPSIAFDPLVGPRSTQRTFTSVDAQPGTWTASFEGLAGVTATASPPQFPIEPGQSQAVRFTFTPSTQRGGYADGAAVLTNAADGRTVRLPVVLRPEVFELPEQLNFGAAQPDGRAPLPVPTGYQGQLSALGYGLAAPETRRDQTVGPDPVGDEDLDRLAQPGRGVAVFDLTVPPGAQALGVEIGGAALADTFADLDLYVFHDDEGDGFRADDLVDSSATAVTQEAVLVLPPDPGAYRVSVRAFAAEPVATFDLTTWLVNDPAPDVLADPPGPGLRISGDPLPATPGGLPALELEWSGLDQPGVYIGLITFHATATPIPGNNLGDMIVVITR
jgi:hypothetical protein